MRGKRVKGWKKEGWQGLPKAPRTDRATPAEAQAMWERVEKPTYHKGAAALKAQGRQVGHGAIWNWKRAGRSGVAAKTAAETNSASGAKPAAAAPPPTHEPAPAHAQR